MKTLILAGLFLVLSSWLSACSPHLPRPQVVQPQTENNPELDQVPPESSPTKPQVDEERSESEGPVENSQPTLALAPERSLEPTPETATEAPPTVGRTSVVIGNGRIEPVRSFWLKFPSGNDSLKAIVAYTLAKSTSKDGSVKSWNKGGTEYICADATDDGANDYLSFLLPRYGMVYRDQGAHYSESRKSCSGSESDIPVFRSELSQKTRGEFGNGVANPDFLCNLEGSNNHWLLGFESLDQDRKLVVRIHLFQQDPWNFQIIDLSTYGLQADEMGQPHFDFASAETKVTLHPYQALGQNFRGSLLLGDEENKNLSCRFLN